MAGQVVVFDYSTWALRFPQLAVSVSAPLAAIYFQEAALYCDNTPCSPVQDINVRTLYLNLLTAHIATLNASINGQAPNPLVGRINSATEGSVSVQTDNQYPPGTVQWYQQTPMGAAFWAASSKYRRMLYVPGNNCTINPFQVPARVRLNG